MYSAEMFNALNILLCTIKKFEKSKYYLLFSNKSIYEIAEDLSFSSQSHFSSVFKKIVGTTPNKYKKHVHLISLSNNDSFHLNTMQFLLISNLKYDRPSRYEKKTTS